MKRDRGNVFKGQTVPTINVMKGDKRKSFAFGCFAFLFGFALALSYYIREERGFLSVLPVFVAGCAGAFFLLYMIEWSLTRLSDCLTVACSLDKRKTWLTFFLVLLCVNMLCLMTYYPGVGMNDGLNILKNGMKASMHFPVFYVAFIKVLKIIGQCLGSLQISIALHSIVQIILISGILSGMIVWLLGKKVNRWIRGLSIAYFVFSPLLAMYAISMLRDTVFGLLIAVITAVIYELLDSSDAQVPKKTIWVLLVAACMGVMFLRSNGPYIVVPLLAVLIIMMKEHRKALGVTAICIVIALSLSNVATHLFSTGHLFQEAVGIPIQQVFAVVANDGAMSEEDLAFVEQLMPLEKIKESYNPYSSDTIKWSSNFDRKKFNANRFRFMKIWLRVLPANFGIYVTAYLKATFWFWAPRQEGTVQCFFTLVPDPPESGWPIGFIKEHAIQNVQILPRSLQDVLTAYYSLAKYYLREGICFWILAAMGLLMILRRGKKYLLVVLPSILMWASIMLSTPVSYSFRYCFAYAYELPLFLVLLLEHTEQPSVQVSAGKT